MIEKIKSLTQKERGLITKAIDNPEKFKNMMEKYKDVIYFLSDIHVGLSTNMKFVLITNDLPSIPKCKTCGNDTKLSVNTYKFSPYCSLKCYGESKKSNNSQFKNIEIDGVSYKTIKEAEKTLGISRFKLVSNNFDENFLQDIEKYKITKDFLSNNKESIKKLSKIHNIPMTLLKKAHGYFGVSTKFEQIEESSRMILENKEMLVELSNVHSAFKIASDLGVSQSTVLNYMNHHDIERKYFKTSLAQQEIALFVESLGFSVLQNNREILPSKKEIDIWIPEKNLGIEYNGLYHHREKRNYHQEKTLEAVSVGIKLVHIFEDEWRDKRKLIENKLKHILGISEKTVYARKCSIVSLKSIETKEFYESNHIQGYKPCSINYGLVFEDSLVACMSFKGNVLERYATSFNVVGGFSKLLKHSIKENGFLEIFSFANLAWSHPTENAYIKNGFKEVSKTSPNYFWVKNGIRYTRNKFQKHKLKNFLNYSLEKTETEIMQENGYFRVFDCGHVKMMLTIL